VALGDVSGKGVAAALLMSQLHALFRVLVPGRLPLGEVCRQVSRTFCESTPASHYATLVLLRATPDGTLEVINAGHPPALACRAGQVTEMGATGLPLGMFCVQDFAAVHLSLGRGDFVVIYSDGIVEAVDTRGQEFGRERLGHLVAAHSGLSAGALASCVEHELDFFTGDAPRSDDRTLAILRRR
jgi:sigma-B regulation protein RsbU (phosphoserine phosphatase)